MDKGKAVSLLHLPESNGSPTPGTPVIMQSSFMMTVTVRIEDNLLHISNTAVLEMPLVRK